MSFFRKTKKRDVFDKGDPSKMYNLLECLGEGTYGTVWTGTEVATGRTCAVKIVRIDDDLEEIELEIRIMKEADSPYIVKFVGSHWGDRKKIWMVMEHCACGSLNDLMYVCDITLDMEQVKATASGIAMGLKYLHKKFIIHRDIKAGNVLLTDQGHIRLADFGVSCVLKKASDRTTSAIGAPFWMAPEVINESPYDGRADVWSLGITIIELFEGRPPNSHINAMKALFLIPQQPPPKLKNKNLPNSVHDFVKVCLTKTMKKRPSSKQIMQHEFLKEESKRIDLNQGRSVVLQRLVQRSLKKIEKWRQEGDEEKPDANENNIENQEGKEQSEVGDEEPPEESMEQMLYHNGSRTMEGMQSQKSSFLNPAVDSRFRSTASNVDVLRDVQAPNETRSKFDRHTQNMMGQDGLTDMLNMTAGSSQAAVMTKEFIMLLKTIYKSDPSVFSNKAPKNWTGEDITVAVVKTLNKVLDEGGQNTQEKKDPANQEEELLNFMNLGNLLDDKDGTDAIDELEPATDSDLEL